MNTVAFTGSRTLPASAHQLVASIVESLLTDKHSLSCGCAVGADAAVVSAVLDKGEAERLTLFVIGGPCGTGFAGPHSALAEVLDATSAGATVKWWAGGGESTRLRVRLVARSLECMSSASSVIGFVSAMPSKPWKGTGPWYSCGSGSWSSLAAMAENGGSATVFPVGEAENLPLPQMPMPGHWIPAGTGNWSKGWSFVPDPAA